MLTAVAQTLAAELAATGFMPDPLGVKLVGARIADRGEYEFARLSQAIVPPQCLRAVCAHHLGIGASFTEFLAGGLPLDREFGSEVASLGGIAHTIFALFDALLDVSECAPELFGGDTRFAADPTIRSEQELVVRLVELYFHKLGMLCSGASRVRALLERTIHKLYAAEIQSALRGEIGWKTWWRKNALPIVVMGLPAWFFIPRNSKIEFVEHMLWLGRVGEFLGWLDDFSDYERDCASGHANRLRLQDEVSIKPCARRVAARGQRVLRYWDLHNEVSPARDTFTVVAWKWLAIPEFNLPPSPSAPDASGSAR